MKFVKINGIQYIVLEENDKVCITTPDELNKTQIEINEKEKKLDISGNCSIVNSIKGDYMLEKIYIPRVLSSREIIEKCDKWFNMFKQVHDVFKKMVLSNEYREQNITMELSFTKFISMVDKNIKGRIISLDLKQHSIIIKEGVTISIDEENEDIYSYLVACVIDYYISQNYGDEKIDLMRFNGALYSNVKRDRGNVVPMIAFLGTLTESIEYSRIISSIICNHNLGESSEQIIDNLKNSICNQQISDRIDSNINYSSKQCEHILKKAINKKK